MGVEILPDRLPDREHHLRHIALAGEDQVVAALDANGRRATRHGDAGRDVEGAVGIGLVGRVDAVEPRVVGALRQLLVDALAEEAAPELADARGLRIALVAVGGACREAGHVEGVEALALRLGVDLHVLSPFSWVEDDPVSVGLHRPLGHRTQGHLVAFGVADLASEKPDVAWAAPISARPRATCWTTRPSAASMPCMQSRQMGCQTLRRLLGVPACKAAPAAAGGRREDPLESRCRDPRFSVGRAPSPESLRPIDVGPGSGTSRWRWSSAELLR